MKGFTRLVAQISIAAVVFTSAGSVAAPVYAGTDAQDNDKTAIVSESDSVELQEDTVPADANDGTTVPGDNGNDNPGNTGEGGDNPGGEGGETIDPEPADPEPVELKTGAIKENGKWRYYVESKDAEGNPIAVPKKGTG